MVAPVMPLVKLLDGQGVAIVPGPNGDATLVPPIKPPPQYEFAGHVVTRPVVVLKYGGACGARAARRDSHGDGKRRKLEAGLARAAGLLGPEQLAAGGGRHVGGVVLAVTSKRAHQLAAAVVAGLVGARRAGGAGLARARGTQANPRDERRPAPR